MIARQRKEQSFLSFKTAIDALFKFGENGLLFCDKRTNNIVGIKTLVLKLADGHCRRGQLVHVICCI